jgi:hypothetical protein
MEPLSALGVASNVVQFVDFATKLVSQTVRIHRAAQSNNKDGSSLVLLTTELEKYNRDMTKDLESSLGSNGMSPEDEQILKTCAECAKISSNLLTTLISLKSSKVTAWTSFVAALKTIWKESEIEELRHTLDSYRQQISLYLLAAVRYGPFPLLLKIILISTEKRYMRFKPGKCICQLL